MSLPNIFVSLSTVLKEVLVDEILQLNNESKRYGLIFTAEEAKEIIEARNLVLRNYGRVELNIEVTGKLIRNFCASPFISQENYLSTLKELQEIFYYMKTETEDEIGDDELIALIKNFYNNTCEGSIELLQGRELELFLRNYRPKIRMAFSSPGEDS